MGFKSLFSFGRERGAPNPSQDVDNEVHDTVDQEGVSSAQPEIGPFSDLQVHMDQVSVPEDPTNFTRETDDLTENVDHFQESLDKDSKKKGAFAEWASKKGSAAELVSKLFSRDKKKTNEPLLTTESPAEYAGDLRSEGEHTEAPEESEPEEDLPTKSVETIAYIDEDGGEDSFAVTPEHIQALRRIAAFDTGGTFDEKEEKKFITWLKKRGRVSGLSKMMKDHYGYLKKTLVEEAKKMDAEYEKLYTESNRDCSIYRNYNQTYSITHPDSSEPRGYAEEVFTTWAEAKNAFLKKKELAREARESEHREFELLELQNNEQVFIEALGSNLYEVVCPNEEDDGALYRYRFYDFGSAKEFFQEKHTKYPVVPQPIFPEPSFRPAEPSFAFGSSNFPPRGIQSFGGGGERPRLRGVEREIGDLKKDFLSNFFIKDVGGGTFEVVSPTHFDSNSNSFVGGKNTKKFSDFEEAKKYFLKEKTRLINSGLSFDKKDPFAFAA